MWRFRTNTISLMVPQRKMTKDVIDHQDHLRLVIKNGFLPSMLMCNSIIRRCGKGLTALESRHGSNMLRTHKRAGHIWLNRSTSKLQGPPLVRCNCSQTGSVLEISEKVVRKVFETPPCVGSRKQSFWSPSRPFTLTCDQSCSQHILWLPIWCESVL